jgi:AAA domain-containing protein
MAEARPLHLHTVESVCTDLIGGRAVGVGLDGRTHSLDKETARAVLFWYFKNRAKWASSVTVGDAEAIVDAAKVKPPAMAETAAPGEQKKRSLELVKVEAHRFAGLHAFSDGGRPPESFIFEPTKPITLLEGWNGSGKTSVLNAVIWCLTGQLLRPQRKPEETEEEFAFRIQLDASSPPTEHKLTPVTPLPDNRFPPDLSREKLPLDTWVALTFSDEEGNRLPPVRRAQTRTARGAVTETAADLASLGLDPIAAKIGTTIPGLLPFIQIGAVSEFGQAIAQLTGLSDLVDLAKHATRVQQRIDKEFTNARKDEIDQQNDAFRQARNDLQVLLVETPNLKPAGVLPDPATEIRLEDELIAIEEHFTACKTRALEDAKQVLGTNFDPSDKAARDSLEDSISPALQQLNDFGKLASAARLAGLSKLTDEQVINVEKLVAEINNEAKTLAELTTAPDVATRRQLYARVATWMREQGETDLSTCKVCGGSLEDAIDAKTGRLVGDELSEALTGDAELIGHTVSTWAASRLGKLARNVPEELAVEIKRNLPAAPTHLLISAIATELFDTTPFKGVLAVLQPATRTLAESHFAALPAFAPLAVDGLPAAISTVAGEIGDALSRIHKAISFGRWQKAHKEAVNAAVMAVITQKSLNAEPVTDGSPLGVKLVALSGTVKNVAPINSALEYCARMSKALTPRREKEKRINEYEVASEALGDVIAIGILAQRQVESLRTSLEGRATYWRNKIYNNAYSTSGYGLVGSGMDSKGSLALFVGSNGISAPAQHVSNASALRASLVGFYFAFWEHVQNARGGLKLLILDDPQELLDDDNRDRLARTLPEIVKVGAQLLLTTHNRLFARMSVAEARKADLVEHRSVHPVNEMRATAKTAPAIEELDRKRDAFEYNVDDATKAQDYVVEARVFIEERLADLFDDPTYPAFSASSKAPIFADYLARLRGLIGKPPNELFRKKLIIDFCNDAALKEGAGCLTLLNKAHHRDKSKISYKDVKDEAENLRRLRARIEDVHEEFRRWKWRDATASPSNVVPLKAANCPSFVLDIHPDLAAFTGALSKSGSQDEVNDKFDSAWFENKSFFYLKNENMGFAAPATSIVVVESEPKPGNDRNLVIALHKGEVLARRLLRPQGDAVLLALAAQTPNPRKSPPTRMLDPSEPQIHRVLGVIFDDVPPPAGRQEAVQIHDAPSLQKVVTSYRVRDDSALPLALPGQIVLGGTAILPADLGAYESKFVALTLTDGSSIFKRVGPTLSGLKTLRQFESIGGLGDSEVIVTEVVEGQFEDLRVMEYARQVLGVIYESQTEKTVSP